MTTKATLISLLRRARQMRALVAREGPLLVVVAGCPDNLTEEDALVAGARYRCGAYETLDQFHDRLRAVAIVAGARAIVTGEGVGPPPDGEKLAA
jgi:hypothetical protein